MSLLLSAAFTSKRRVAAVSENQAGNQSGADNRYFRLKVTGLDRQHEDEFTELCFEQGAEGVAEDLPFVQRDLRYDPDVVETAAMDANVYFSHAPGEGVLLQLQSRFPGVKVETFSEENKDWLAEWKKGFKPFRFAGPFWIVPSWCEAPAEAEQVLLIDPGMAFGTGTHETTRLAAGLLLEEVARHRPRSLIDVGTGTGVLALVAHRLGVMQVVGIDNDPEARRTARENLAHNEASAIEIPNANIQDIDAKFDIVVANIIDGVLTLLRHDLNRALERGGRMILSGVLVDREAEFYENFTRETGLKLLKKVTEGEWSAAILEKA
jgi:ribosomal protein L11 methyltransferase